MSAIEEFLGEVVSRVVRGMMERGHPGIRLQNVTPFDPVSFLSSLNSGLRPRVAIAGASVNELIRKTKFPPNLLTSDLAVATEWRNDPGVTETVIIVAFGEEERLGSFHRFAEVRDIELYREICELGREALCPNRVQSDWWLVLSKMEVSRQVSVHRLASYYLFLKSKAKHIPEASREGLYHLGLLPSREFFEHASQSQLLKNFRANRQLTNRIELLSNPDRDRLSRGVEVASDEQRPKLIITLGKVLKYNRLASDTDRSALLCEDVRSLFEARKKAPKPKSSRPIPIERAGVDAILDGDDEELMLLGERLRETINNFEENETPNVTLELTNRTEQASAKIPPPLMRLLSRTVNGTTFGGKFRFQNVDNFQAALNDIDNAEFTPFSLEGEKSCQTLLKRVVDANLIEPEVLGRWKAFVEARAILAEQALAIAISPMVALASDKKLLKAGNQYLEAYQDLMSAIRDRYEAVAVHSDQGARLLCAQLIILDTVLFETENGSHGLLSPLHPLHLWKYVRLAEQLRDERGTLSDEYKRVLGESAEKLPHFVTALFVPEGLISNHHAVVLPESHQLATLPCYQEESPHFAGDEGQDRLIRIMRKFLVLYPHAKKSLRVCIVDPPDFPSLMEQLASHILSEDLPVEGMNVEVVRTLDRVLSLGSDDQQLETIGSVFSAENNPRFVLHVHQAKTTYQDILEDLRQDPVHILAIFDPSRSQVGQFVSRDSGFVHPLVLPKEFKYDQITDQLVITPAATGDLFDLYYSLQNRLNNSLTGSHFGISSSLGPGFPTSGELLKHCTWLVLGDKFMDSLPMKGGHLISFELGTRRDIIVLSENLTKFERAFGHYLRLANLDPTDEAVRELIVSSAELVLKQA